MIQKTKLLTNPIVASYLFLFGLSLFAIGIPWSVFLVSNSVIILSLLITIRYDKSKNAIILNNQIGKDLEGIINTPLLLFMILFFISVLLSGLWSEEYTYWIWFSRMLLPFLLLPLAFYIHGNLSDNQWNFLFYLFLLITFSCTSILLVQYIQNYKEMNALLLQGKPIVSHISHIRFSILLAIAAIVSLHYTLMTFRQHGNKLRWLFPAVLIFFFIVNHIFSVKTGIIGMDLGLVVYLTIYFLKQKAYRALMIAAGLLMLLVLIAFYTIPSLQNKLFYTLFQFKEWQRGKWLYYSDIERWVSLQMGIEIIKHYPVLGSGIGDLYQITKETYLECLNHNEPKLPHNQFLFTWAFSGLPALFSLFGVIYYSALQKKWMNNPMISGIQFVLLFSFLFEYTLGTQIGCSLYVFFTLISWSLLERNE